MKCTFREVMVHDCWDSGGSNGAGMTGEVVIGRTRAVRRVKIAETENMVIDTTIEANKKIRRRKESKEYGPADEVFGFMRRSKAVLFKCLKADDIKRL